ncbi:MAG: hypothetical protein OXK74_02085 [Gemmatimonadota bacterium]|nr:hypothetical protein [Gemmatimonadota bacterium]
MSGTAPDIRASVAEDLGLLIRILRAARVIMRTGRYHYTQRNLTHALTEAGAQIEAATGYEAGPLVRAVYCALASSDRVPDSGIDPEADVDRYAEGLHRAGAVALVNEALAGLSAARYALDECAGIGHGNG